MEVYIEAVILDNFFITFMTTLLSYRILGKRISKLRAFLASLIGTAAAIGYPFISLPSYALIIIKLILCLLLSTVLFCGKCNILKGSGIFLMVTFFFGGAMFCLSYMVNADATLALTQPVASIPIGLIIAGGLVFYIAFKKASVRLKRLKDAKKFTADIELKLFERNIKLIGFMDTGNRLYDNVTGLPVLILSLNSIMHLLEPKTLTDILCQRGERVARGAHYITYSTLSSKNNSLLVLKPNEIRLYSDKCEHRIENVMVGLSLSKLDDSMQYDMILHPALIDNL